MQEPVPNRLLARSASPPRDRRTRSPGIDQAWSVLEPHWGWLRSVVITRSGEPQAADEILQEVALAYLNTCTNSHCKLKNKRTDADRQAEKSAPDPDKLAPWLYQVAVRQSLMYRRTQGRRRKHETEYVQRKASRHSPVSQPFPDGLEWLLSNERRQGIRETIVRLNPKDAEMLMLKYNEDWTYRQLADHLGISESAVETRLHRARKKFRQLLIEHKLAPTKT